MDQQKKVKFLPLFTKTTVKQEGSDKHPGILKLQVACACGAPSHLWFGSRSGEVNRLDRQFNLSSPLQVFDRELTDLRIAQEGQRLVALGYDASAPSSAKYKIFDTSPEDEPAVVVTHRVCPPRSTEHRVTCFDVSPSLRHLAVGTAAGVVHLFRGRDLGQEKPLPAVLGAESGMPVTAVHFLEQQAQQGSRTVLFVCTLKSVRSFLVDEAEVRQLLNDPSGGAEEQCSCVFPAMSALFTSRCVDGGYVVVAYDPDEGNMSFLPMEGERMHEGDRMQLAQHKSYFVTVAAEGGAGAYSGTPPAPSTMLRQNVEVHLKYPHMHTVAFRGVFADVTHVVAGMGGIFVVSRGGADGNTVLFQLVEKDLQEQLDILLKKRQYEWAAKTAVQCGASKETIVRIYRQHGDTLMEKPYYDEALAAYCKTIDEGIPLEPSYVVERYLDVQLIGHVAQYLRKLHEKNFAEREHTALLLKCYTKLKDFSTLQTFLETTPVSQYDAATAIEVLEVGGCYEMAVDVARKVQSHRDFVRMSLEHFQNYASIVEYLRGLPRAEGGELLLEHGRVLMRHAPQEAVELVRDICCLREPQARAGGGHGAPPEPADEHPQPVQMLPIFVDDQPQLKSFLRSLLLEGKGTTLPAAEGERLFPTLLEMMCRSHRDLLLAAPDGEEGASSNKREAQVLHDEIMWLIRQYPGEEGLTASLMLCQTYGFVDGFFHTAERLGRFQLLMNWCFEHKDAKRLLDACKRCGPSDQSLWVQALSFFAADESGDHAEEIGELLEHIEKSDLMPLLMVIETLQKSPGTTVGAAAPYLQSQFRRLGESVETSRAKARQDRQDIARLEQEIKSLRTEAQVFQNTKCNHCGITLDVPAVHFFCGHSYHAHCIQQEDQCPRCSSEALPKANLKEQREAQARNADDFFKYLQDGGGERSVQAIGEWCNRGAFDERPM